MPATMSCRERPAVLLPRRRTASDGVLYDQGVGAARGLCPAGRVSLPGLLPCRAGRRAGRGACRGGRTSAQLTPHGTSSSHETPGPVDRGRISQ